MNGFEFEDPYFDIIQQNKKRKQVVIKNKLQELDYIGITSDKSFNDFIANRKHKIRTDKINMFTGMDQYYKDFKEAKNVDPLYKIVTNPINDKSVVKQTLKEVKADVEKDKKESLDGAGEDD